jgi:hypothetical protein
MAVEANVTTPGGRRPPGCCRRRRLHLTAVARRRSGGRGIIANNIGSIVIQPGAECPAPTYRERDNPNQPQREITAAGKGQR